MTLDKMRTSKDMTHYHLEHYRFVKVPGLFAFPFPRLLDVRISAKKYKGNNFDS